MRHCLYELAQAHPQGLWRVRLLLNAQGKARAEAFAMDAAPAQVRLQLADRASDTLDLVSGVLGWVKLDFH